MNWFYDNLNYFGMAINFVCFCGYLVTTHWLQGLVNLVATMGIAMLQTQLVENESKRIAALVAEKFEEAK